MELNTMDWLCPECGLSLSKHLISIDCPVSDVDAPGPADEITQSNLDTAWQCHSCWQWHTDGETRCPECDYDAPEPADIATSRKSQADGKAGEADSSTAGKG